MDSTADITDSTTPHTAHRPRHAAAQLEKQLSSSAALTDAASVLGSLAQLITSSSPPGGETGQMQLSELGASRQPAAEFLARVAVSAGEEIEALQRKLRDADVSFGAAEARAEQLQLRLEGTERRMLANAAEKDELQQQLQLQGVDFVSRAAAVASVAKKELQQLQSKLDAAERMGADAAIRIANLEKQLEEVYEMQRTMEQRAQQAEAESEARREELSRTGAALEASQQQQRWNASTSNEQLQLLQKMVTEANERRAASDAEAQRSAAQVAELEVLAAGKKQSEQLERRLAQAEAAKAESQVHSAELWEKIGSLELQVASKATSEQKLQQLEVRWTDSEAARTSAQAAAAEHARARADGERRLAEVTDSAREQLQSVREQLAASERGKAEMEVQLTQLCNTAQQKQQLSSDLRAARAAQADSAAQAKDLSGRVLELKGQLADAASAVQQKAEDLQKMHAELDAARAEASIHLMAEQRQADHFKQIANQADRRLDLLQKQLSTAEAASRDSEARLPLMEQRIADLEAQLATAADCNALLQDATTAAESKVTEAAALAQLLPT